MAGASSARGSAGRDVLRRAGAASAAWIPLGVLLLGYAAATWLNAGYPDRPTAGTANRLGFPLHVTEPVTADRVLTGVLPSQWLQQRLYESGTTHWYDALVAVVYASHFVAVPVLTLVLWWRDRAAFRRWIVLVTALAGLGLVTYVVYPMAPPWLASDLGDAGAVARISGLGWEVLGLEPLGRLIAGGQSAGNPVASMPSLHAAFALLVTIQLSRGRPPWVRALLGLYPVAMAFVLVYTGEHHVVDVLVAAAYVVVVVLAVRLVRRRPVRERTGRRGTAP